METWLIQNGAQIVFLFTGLLGGMMHYLKKYLKGETKSSLYQWFGKSNLPATIYTLVCFTFVMIGAIASDVVNSHTGFWVAVYSGFITGFAIDSGFNSDQDITEQLNKNKNDLNELFGSGDDDSDREDSKQKKDVKRVKFVPKS